MTVKDTASATAAAVARCRSSSIGFGNGYPGRPDSDPRGAFSRTRSFPRPEGLKAINTNLPLSGKGVSAEREVMPRSLVTSPVWYDILLYFLWCGIFCYIIPLYPIPIHFVFAVTFTTSTRHCLCSIIFSISHIHPQQSHTLSPITIIITTSISSTSNCDCAYLFACIVIYEHRPRGV